MRTAYHASDLLAVPADPVFSAIEAHREALSEFTAETAFFQRKRGGLSKPEFKAQRDGYEAATNTLAIARITTLAGLKAFTAYLADLQAYGVSQIAPGVYAIECWHLSDAMETITATLRRVTR